MPRLLRCPSRTLPRESLFRGRGDRGRPIEWFSNRRPVAGLAPGCDSLLTTTPRPGMTHPVRPWPSGRLQRLHQAEDDAPLTPGAFRWRVFEHHATRDRVAGAHYKM